MRRVVLAIVSTVASLVLLLSFKTHGISVATPPAASSNATGSTSTSGTASSSGTSSTSGSTSSATATKTATGEAADTRYGPVQVKVTVTNGKITSATAVEYPVNDRRDQEINAYAIPALNREAVQSGSASIDMISGATYTSEGYVQSLQSALDKVS
jgi:uncharacterized protein with FMN-binding domain